MVCQAAIPLSSVNALDSSFVPSAFVFCGVLLSVPQLSVCPPELFKEFCCFLQGCACFTGGCHGCLPAAVLLCVPFRVTGASRCRSRLLLVPLGQEHLQTLFLAGFERPGPCLVGALAGRCCLPLAFLSLSQSTALECQRPFGVQRGSQECFCGSLVPVP